MGCNRSVPHCANRVDEEHRGRCGVCAPCRGMLGLPKLRFVDVAGVKTNADSHSCKGDRKEPNPGKGALPCCFPSLSLTVESDRLPSNSCLSCDSISIAKLTTSHHQANPGGLRQAPRQRRQIDEAVLAMPSPLGRRIKTLPSLGFRCMHVRSPPLSKNSSKNSLTGTPATYVCVSPNDAKGQSLGTSVGFSFPSRLSV